jgi:hypothetical protein
MEEAQVKRLICVTARSVGHFRILGADTAMTLESKRKPRQDDRDREERERMRREEVEHERMRQEEALDEALKNTFPASDPVSVEQP